MIDEIDVKILNLLKKNSRLSFADLGRKINLSPSATRERVQKMEDNEIIKKYSISIDNRKLGYDIEAFILLKVFSGKLKSILAIITNYNEIKEVHRITGDQNLHLKIVVKNQIELQNLIDELMNYGDTNTFLILKSV